MCSSQLQKKIGTNFALIQHETILIKKFGGSVMWKTIVIGTVLGLFLASCASMPAGQNQPQEVIVKVQATNPTEVKVTQDNDKERINKSMEVPNQEGHLSQLSFISKNQAFVKIFSGLSVSDVTRLWNDLVVLENNTQIRDVRLFINSPGGDAFSGLALADQIERARRKGFRITAHASGIIASAAVPVFAVCNERFAAPGTIFMVHEAALWKWPGRETASDIRSQNELMHLLRERYIGKLSANSKLDKTKWEELEKKTTWFSAEKAMDWGLVDKIE
jgi:ATP-dependent protease ClpP protease subunit